MDLVSEPVNTEAMPEPTYRPSTRDTTRQKFGSWRLRYTGLDAKTYSVTAKTKTDCIGRYNAELKAMQLGTWISPKARKEQQRLEEEREQLTFGIYFERFVSDPERSETTRATYRSMYRNGIKQKLGDRPLASVTRGEIAKWWTWLRTTYPQRASRNADCYTLVASVFNAAVNEELIEASPCKVSKAGTKPEPNAERFLTTAQMQTIIDGLPRHYRLAALIAGACALRIGEWSELRKSDISITRDDQGTVLGAELIISRQVREEAGTKVVGETKTRAPRRVPVPSTLAPLLAAHIQNLDADALVFPNDQGGWTDRRRFNRAMKKAAEPLGLSQVSSHDLRHYGGTLFAQSGGTLKEAMARLGHKTIPAALRYQHASNERAQQIADRMDLPTVDLSNVASLADKRREKNA